VGGEGVGGDGVARARGSRLDTLREPSIELGNFKFLADLGEVMDDSSGVQQSDAARRQHVHDVLGAHADDVEAREHLRVEGRRRREDARALGELDTLPGCDGGELRHLALDLGGAALAPVEAALRGALPALPRCGEEVCAHLVRRLARRLVEVAQPAELVRIGACALEAEQALRLSWCFLRSHPNTQPDGLNRPDSAP